MTRFDARVWVLWLLAGALPAILLRNPFYLLILLLISRLTARVCGSAANPVHRFGFWRIAASILLFSTLFNMLTAHTGETILFRLPEGWWLIGGILTAEAAAYGLISGLSLVTILSFFMAFNAIVPVSQLARLTPRALHELGLVLLVSVTYLPELTQQWQRIREAQAIRGHRVHALTDWRPLALPLLVGGLERSLSLAETMVTRGFASAEPRQPDRRVRLLMLAGLVLIFTAVLLLAWGQALGWLLLLAGASAILFGYGLAGRALPTTRYRSRAWMATDTSLVAAASVPLLLIVLPLPFIDRQSFGYSPYPVLTLPGVEGWFAAALLLLLLPAVMELSR